MPFYLKFKRENYYENKILMKYIKFYFTCADNSSRSNYLTLERLEIYSSFNIDLSLSFDINKDIYFVYFWLQQMVQKALFILMYIKYNNYTCNASVRLSAVCHLITYFIHLHFFIE